MKNNSKVWGLMVPYVAGDTTKDERVEFYWVLEGQE